MYLYALCAGHYHCSPDYLVDRQSYDSFLVLYVHQGSAWYSQGGVRHTIPEHGFGFVDCCSPHVYGTDTGCEMYWVHFNGISAERIFSAIRRRKEPQPRHFDRSRRSIVDMSEKSELKGHISEPEMNRLLTNLLMEFLSPAEEGPSQNEEAIEAVRTYILENPEKDLSLKELAGMARMSEYHFLRLFRDYVGTTPHSYLIQARLNVAGFYLISSDYSVKEIAFNCGFPSESSFCSSFKARMGETPSAWRKSRTHT